MNPYRPQFFKRGWSTVPVPKGSKNPGVPGWQQRQFTEADFKDGDNTGVLLGEPSGWLVDVDLDTIQAARIAGEFLPPTPCVFGRAGKPRSHWFYVASHPCDSIERRDSKGKMVLELRTKGHTVVPISVHPSGELITFDGNPETVPEPATIGPDDLREPIDSIHRSALAWAVMDKMDVSDNRDGSLRLYACACRAVEHDLDDFAAVTTIRHYAEDQPFERDWSDNDILQRVRDAEKETERGKAVYGKKPKLASVAPELVAKQIVGGDFTNAVGERTIHSTGSELLVYSEQQGRYLRLSKEDADNAVRRRLNAYTFHTTKTVNDVKNALRAECALPPEFIIPGWLGGEGPKDVFVSGSGPLRLHDRTICPATPKFINTIASPVQWNPNAAEPTRWLKFMDELWPHDPGAVRLLRQWCGYLLTPDVSQHKILLMIGPPRSGKGTIARVLWALLGPQSVAGPTLASFRGEFGLQPLIDKTLAIIADARLSTHKDNGIVVERLLSISGQDALTINRKHIGAVNMTLPTRIMIISNEIPKLPDASGAIAKRFLILRLTKSFVGAEDTKLTDTLIGELPGILHWAIDGWDDLQATGRFIVPESSDNATREMGELTSPIMKFLNDRCSTDDPKAAVETEKLYQAYADWCQAVEHCKPNEASMFGRDLSAALPHVKRERRRNGDSRVWHYVGVVLAADCPQWS